MTPQPQSRADPTPSPGLRRPLTKAGRRMLDGAARDCWYAWPHDRQTNGRCLKALLRGGYVEQRARDGLIEWCITDTGRAAVFTLTPAAPSGEVR